MKLSAPHSAAVIAALAIFLTGCSRNPVAPSTGTVGAPADGPLAVSVNPEDTPPADGGTPNTRTFTLTASEEGLATVGRWTLYIRRNSLTMPATITLHVADPEAMEVDVDVQPAAANKFKQTVFLTANLSDVAGFDYSKGGLLSWNGAWVKASYSSRQKQENIVGRFATLGNTMVSYNVSGR